MATPPRVPAGWYDDPSARHERRYWDGTDWTAHVSDNGIATTDQPGARPPLTPEDTAEPPPLMPEHTAQPPPAIGPAAATPPPRRRRAWAVPVIAVAALVALGLLAGLLIWAPWTSPPLLRPAGLTAGPSTTSSVTFRWSRPATGPPPDRYVILHDGQVAGSVPGTVTSYRGTGLAPATAYRYRVAAERGGQRSALSPVIVLTTVTPPLSAARLQGPWTVSIKITRGASGLTGPKSWDETWLATPKCAAGPCDVRLSGGLNGYTFKTTLTRAGAVYQGKIAGNVFPCGSRSKSFPIRSTVRIRVTVATARVDNREWTAGSWTGHMVVTAPYTASGNFYCPASRQVASLTGNP
jgi:uncharacterized protein DUF2510/fibronectin type III domain protein